MEKKDKGIFFRSFIEGINMLPEDIQLDMYKAYTDYVMNGKDYDGDNKTIKAILHMMRYSLDKAQKNYEARCKNGAKGGAPKGNKNATKSTDKQPKTIEKQAKTSLYEYEYEYDNKKNNILSFSQKTKSDEIYKTIIEHLNSLSGRHFSWTATKGKKNRKYIDARLAEGYTVDDFMRVNEIKVKEWLHDPAMRQYIRPETLYCPKHFESYLNQPEIGGNIF